MFHSSSPKLAFPHVFIVSWHLRTLIFDLRYLPHCGPEEQKTSKFCSQAPWSGVGRLESVCVLCLRRVIVQGDGLLASSLPRRAWLCWQQRSFILYPCFFYQQLHASLWCSSSLTLPFEDHEERPHLCKVSSLGLDKDRCSAPPHTPPPSSPFTHFFLQIPASHSLEERSRGLLSQACLALYLGDLKLSKICSGLSSFISLQQVEGAAFCDLITSPFMKRALNKNGRHRLESRGHGRVRSDL